MDMRQSMTLITEAFSVTPADESLPNGFSQEGSGLIEFACGTGRGVISANFEDRHCAIYEYNSKVRPGGGRKTLQWLHQWFDEIDVIDPGEMDSSLGFWLKMRDERLVNRLFDEDQQEIHGNGQDDEDDGL